MMGQHVLFFLIQSPWPTTQEKMKKHTIILVASNQLTIPPPKNVGIRLMISLGSDLTKTNAPFE